MRSPPSLTVLAALAVVAVTSCAPSPSATDRYCDVVKRDQATIDAFATPSVLADPVQLRSALQARAGILSERLVLAPDAVRADLGIVHDVQAQVQTALAVAGFDAKAADQAPVPDLLASARYTDALRSVQQFDLRVCAVGA